MLEEYAVNAVEEEEKEEMWIVKTLSYWLEVTKVQTWMW